MVMASDYTQNTTMGNDDYNTGGTISTPIGFNNLNNALTLIPMGIWTRGTTLNSTGYTIDNDNSGNNGFGFDPAFNGPYGPHPQPTYAAGTFHRNCCSRANDNGRRCIAAAAIGFSTLRILRKSRTA